MNKKELIKRFFCVGREINKLTTSKNNKIEFLKYDLRALIYAYGMIFFMTTLLIVNVF